MAGLSVSIDHIAALRQTGKSTDPNPAAAAVLVELAGADGLVCHLREDRRRVQDRDIRLLRNMVQGKLILEMAATSEMVGIALDTRPDEVTLVPESHEAITTSGGLDLIVQTKAIAETIGALQNNGIPVGVFIDPDPEQVKLAHHNGAEIIEINTGIFCEALGQGKRQRELARIVDAAKLAKRLKMGVGAAGGLDYTTIKFFRDLSEIDEFRIGHSIVSRSILVGMERAVRDMKQLIDRL